MIKKPKKLEKIEAGEYQLTVVTSRLSPNTYKIMRACMEELGLDEASYIRMSITLMNQSKAGK